MNHFLHETFDEKVSVLSLKELLETVVTTLELNFFVTKYYEMSDRDSRKVAIYALNYGLCQKYAIEFGRPTEKREHRLYFVERIFDATQF